MIIAINIRVLSDDFPGEYKSFIFEIIKCLSDKNRDHQFLFITDKKGIIDYPFGFNVQWIATGASSQRPILWKYWLNVPLRTVLKKYKADVFVSFDTASLSVQVPQCIVLQNVFPAETTFLKKSHRKFYQNFEAKFLDKATCIAVTSAFQKKKIIDRYKTTASKIDVVFGGADEQFVPALPDENGSIKHRYTDGKEFFLHTGSIHPSKNIITLLKAFSVFKKRQQTNMKLVLAGTISKNYQSFKEVLTSYKYKNDVVLLENAGVNELVKITGSALCVINPSQQQGFMSSIIEAMRCDVPVLMDENSSMKEIVQEAALYFDANNFKDIADKMMLIYKDEKLQQRLVQKSKPVSEKYSWDITAGLLWKSILKTAEKNR